MECFEVPGRIAVDHIGERLRREKELRGLSWRRASDPTAPTTWPSLAARHKAGDNLLALRVARAGINFLQYRDLLFGEAIVGLGALAKQHGRIKAAPSGIVE